MNNNINTVSMKIIDGKKILLTEDEFNLYKTIVKNYTTQTNKGEEYFEDLFFTNDKGIIIMLKPPSHKQTSFEILAFLQNIFLQQHVREIYNLVDNVCDQMKNKMKEMDKKLELLDSKK